MPRGGEAVAAPPRFPCPRAGCTKTYQTQGARFRTHVAQCGAVPDTQARATPGVASTPIPRGATLESWAYGGSFPIREAMGLKNPRLYCKIPFAVRTET